MEEYIEVKHYIEAQLSFLASPESDFFRGVKEGFTLVKVYIDKRVESIKKVETENNTERG